MSSSNYIDNLSKLLDGVENDRISLQSILNLRNEVLEHSPKSVEVLTALETRAVSMLHTFGKYKDVIVLKNGHESLKNRINAKKN